MKKLLAGSLSLILAALGAGIAPYEAVAGSLSGGGRAGIPVGGFWAGYMTQLTRPARVETFGALTIDGIAIAPILGELARLENPAAPALARLSALQGQNLSSLSDLDVLKAVAAAAKDARLQADAAIAWAQADLAAGRLDGLARTIGAAQENAALLTAEQRGKLKAARESLKLAQASGMVAEGTKSWAKPMDETQELPALRPTHPRAGLSKAAKPLARPQSALAQRVPSTTVRALAEEERAAKRAAASARLKPWLAGGLITLIAIGLPLMPASLLVPAAIVTFGALASILLHESAHLWQLRRLGDGTAAAHGVRSLNPLKLVDPMGTVLVPLASAVATSLAFGLPVVLGWAKPVPVDFNKLADPKRDAMKVALAGPLMNAALAGVFLAVWSVLPAAGLAAGALLLLAKINAGLAVFNMIPLPQLDGGKVAVGLMPQRLYARWVRNDKVPPAYQSIFSKLYEGPSALLNLLGMSGQGQVNLATRAVSLLAFGAFAALSWTMLGAPVLLLLLACSYDYYCIREKIQNENATRGLMGIVQRFSTALARMAEQDDSVQSIVNSEEVEHILKNAFEDLVDELVDSDGFDGLSDAEKWSRFEGSYLDRATAALAKKGLSADSPETIRRLLVSPEGQAYMNELKGWLAQWGAWNKWHSPKKKARTKIGELIKKAEENGGATLGIVAVALLGAGLLGPGFGVGALGLGAFMLGTLGQAPPRKVRSFASALEDPNFKFADKEKALLVRLLSELKHKKKAPVIGMVKEIGEVYKNVTAPRGDINSVVLVGKAGTGKTAAVEGLAQALAESDAQADGATLRLSRMDGRYLMKLNLPRLLQADDPVAALDALLQLIARFNDEDTRAGNRVILFIDEIHQIFEHAKGPLMANLLKEPMRDGELSVVAATTEAEYKKYMEKDDAFRRRMARVSVDESTVEQTLRALEGAQEHYERLYDVTIEPEALKAAAELSRFDQEIFLPGRGFKYLLAAAKEAGFDGQRDRLAFAIKDKAAELRYTLARLGAALRGDALVTQKLTDDEPGAVELYNRASALSRELAALYRRRAAIPGSGVPVVTAELVKEQIASGTGVASGQLTLGAEPLDRLLKMKELLSEEVIGQDETLETIANTIHQNKAGLSDGDRPMGVFYLTGPTGSGKTHLAKRLANFLFQDPDAMIRVDMSEYMEGHSVSRFIGAPPGYVGFDAGGQLTQAVRRKPYSVVLFDEIEKAHPNVFRILLQILGEGRMTDGQGRTVDFKNTLILMTSNIGMEQLDFAPAVASFKELQSQWREAAARGDAAALSELERRKEALAEKLAADTKAIALKITDAAFKEKFAPEFRGRLHADPQVFNRITPKMARAIVGRGLNDLDRILRHGGHRLEWDAEEVELLVNEGYSIELGARPLQNAIDRFVTQPIARQILNAAHKNGNKVVPSRIVAKVVRGEMTITVEPLPPQKVSKASPGEGAPQALFTRAIQAAIDAALTLDGKIPGFSEIDAWAREAVRAYQGSEEKRDTQSSAGPKETPAAATAKTAAAVSSDPLFVETSLDLGSPSSEKELSHYQHERKDPAVKEISAAFAADMTAAGFGEREKDLILRTIEKPDEPHLGWLKLFVEQAKKMTPDDKRETPASVVFSVDERSARIAVRRPGMISERELSMLRRHFAGAPTESAMASWKKADDLNGLHDIDGRRLFFELHRQLSAIPGARLGVSSAGGQTQYWLELPRARPTVDQALAALSAELDGAGFRARQRDALVAYAVRVARATAAALPSSRIAFHFEPIGGGRFYVGVRALGVPEDFDYEAWKRALEADPLLAVERTRGDMGIYGRSTHEKSASAWISTSPAGLVERTGRRFEWEGGKTRELAKGSKGFGDRRMREANKALNDELVALGHSREARMAASAFLRGLSDQIKDMLPEDAEPAAHTTIDERGARIVVGRTKADFSVEETAALKAYFDGNAELKAVLESLGAEILIGAGIPSLDDAGGSVLLHIPPPEAPPASQDGAAQARAPQGEASNASASAARAGLDLAQLAAIAREFSEGLIRQGAERGTTLRFAAADLLAASSTPGQLALARDWIRFEAMHEHLHRVVAAAMILARHGSRAEDEPRILRAMQLLNGSNYSSDAYKPTKSRLSESLAKLLATDSPAKLRELSERYAREDGLARSSYLMPDDPNFRPARNEMILEALYLALSKHGEQTQSKFLLDEWEQRRAPALYAFLRRVEPRRARELYEEWRRDGARPDGWKRLTTLLSIADYGEADDLPELLEIARTNWDGQVETQNTALVGGALAELTARLDAYGLIKATTRRWLAEPLGDGGNYHRLSAALQVAGAAGDIEDLALLERVMRVDPGDSNRLHYMHEMSQHEAASAWARLINRLGLVEQFLSAPEPSPAGQPPLARLQKMLIDTNPIVNKAAVEALRLRLQKTAAAAPSNRPSSTPSPVSSGSPSSPSATSASANPVPRIQLQPPHPKWADGAHPTGERLFSFYSSDQEILENPGSGLARLPAELRARAMKWAELLPPILERLTGVSFTREIRTATKPDGGATVIWVLRQAQTEGLQGGAPARVRNLALRLLHLLSHSGGDRQLALTALSSSFPTIGELYDAIAGINERPDSGFGLDHDPERRPVPQRGELELWLKLDIPAEPEPPRAAPPPAPSGGFHRGGRFMDGFPEMPPY